MSRILLCVVNFFSMLESEYLSLLCAAGLDIDSASPQKPGGKHGKTQEFPGKVFDIVRKIQEFPGKAFDIVTYFLRYRVTMYVK